MSFEIFSTIGLPGSSVVLNCHPLDLPCIINGLFNAGVSILDPRQTFFDIVLLSSIYRKTFCNAVSSEGHDCQCMTQEVGE